MNPHLQYDPGNVSDYFSYGVCQLQGMQFPETELQLYNVYHSEDNWMINI